MRRYLILVLLCIVGSFATSVAAQEVDASLRKGTAWLLEQQGRDGSWRSTTYGQMSSGVGNTALIVNALSQLPPEVRADCEPSLERGVDFLLANLDPAGYVSAPQNSADYPMYATALVSRTLDRLPSERGRDVQRRMRAYLLDAQRSGGNDDPLRGGWPQIGGDLNDARAERNVNVSVSRHVLEALGERIGEQPRTREEATAFLARCQNDDGGFRFLPLDDDPLNKAGVDSAGAPRSYGTATADGVLALLGCGVPANDPRIQRGLRWLELHTAMDGVPGISDDRTAPAGSRDALRFYYYAALASVMSGCHNSPLVRHRDELIDLIIRQQRADGSWANSVTLMREDDPLIATALAASALATLHKSAAP